MPHRHRKFWPLVAAVAVGSSLVAPVANADTTDQETELCMLKINLRENEQISPSEKAFRKAMNEGNALKVKKSNAQTQFIGYSVQKMVYTRQIEDLQAMRKDGEITDSVYFREVEPLEAMTKVIGELIPQLQACATGYKESQKPDSSLSTADGEPNDTAIGIIAGSVIALVGLVIGLPPQVKNILPPSIATLLP
ncbi:hypothetical protein [Corynebacterium sp. HMSC073D01]|uniref:hypothetical protein n=1 Tax=Corynebacterium sp. HMSC073D01 TaxID=1739536 RepID=UPI0008A13B2E|nr:hypothetical protein [Corynebacterium sp. HMSC073D01]OFO49559.1 hypothetical protein HMPREF3044_07230 [Corynebacterium sp. HMSC073D01]